MPEVFCFLCDMQADVPLVYKRLNPLYELAMIAQERNDPFFEIIHPGKFLEFCSLECMQVWETANLKPGQRRSLGEMELPNVRERG